MSLNNPLYIRSSFPFNWVTRIPLYQFLKGLSCRNIIIVIITKPFIMTLLKFFATLKNFADYTFSLIHHFLYIANMKNVGRDPRKMFLFTVVNSHAFNLLRWSNIPQQRFPVWSTFIMWSILLSFQIFRETYGQRDCRKKSKEKCRPVYFNENILEMFYQCAAPVNMRWQILSMEN